MPSQVHADREMSTFDDEARAYAAWCLSEAPQKARKTSRNGQPRKSVSFVCLVKYRDALLSAFQEKCHSALEYEIYQSRQYPVYPSIDRVTVNLTWPEGTLRVDYFTSI